MSLFLIKAVLMSFLPFYRVDFQIDRFPSELTYVEYNQGRVIGSKTLTPNESKALEEFLRKNTKGWQYDLKTYVPGQLFTSSKMKINCLAGGTVVINYEDAGKDWVQISRKITGRSCPPVTRAADSGK